MDVFVIKAAIALLARANESQASGGHRAVDGVVGQNYTQMGVRTSERPFAIRSVLSLPTLFDTRRSAGPASQVVKPRSADLSSAGNGHRFHVRGVDEKSPLHSDLMGNTSHCEGLAWSTAAPAYYDTLERLGPGALTLGNADVNSDGVTGLELFYILVGFKSD